MLASLIAEPLHAAPAGRAEGADFLDHLAAACAAWWQCIVDDRPPNRSKWINQSAPDLTDFNVPSVPAFDYFFRMPELPQRIGLLWIGRRIPTSDARWMGRLLARLPAKQIRDAFRAADYTPREVEEFSRVVERRIVELENL